MVMRWKGSNQIQIKTPLLLSGGLWRPILGPVDRLSRGLGRVKGAERGSQTQEAGK